MQLFIPLWIAEALFAGLFILLGHKRNTYAGFACKMCASVLFLVNGIYAYTLSDRTAYGVTVLIGLAVGVFGDAFLSTEVFTEKKNAEKLQFVFYIVGGVFFLLGHVAYMTAFARLLREAHAFRFLSFAAAWGGMLLCIAVTIYLCRIQGGKLAVPVAFYALAISCMFALAICTALQVFRDNMMMRCVLLAAPVLFITSDVTLAMRAADAKRFGSLSFRAVSLTVYFLAQMLFGISILLQ